MSAKWTEGPLQYRKSGADDFTIYNDMGADLALVLGWPTEADETDPEAEANAKLYAAAPDGDLVADHFLLPSRLQALQPQLQLYVDELMRPSSYHEPFLLRGIYFCGDASEAAAHLARGAAEAPLLDERVDDETAADDAPQALPESLRQPAFVRDLFEQKVFAEIGLKDHLTAQRSNGLASMVARIKAEAAKG